MLFERQALCHIDVILLNDNIHRIKLYLRRHWLFEDAKKLLIQIDYQGKKYSNTF